MSALDVIFSMKSNVLLIPHWAVKTIRRNGLKLEQLLDFNQVRQVFSPDDLIGIAALGKDSFGKRVSGDREGFSDSIIFPWSMSAKTPEDKTLLRTIEASCVDQHYTEAVEEAFFKPESYRHDVTNAYEVVPMGTKALAVVVYPGAFARHTAAQQLDIVRAVLRQLYVYEQHNVVTALPMTKRYLELLQQQ